MERQSPNPLQPRWGGRGTRRPGRRLYLIAALLLVVGLLAACAQQTPQPAAQQPEPTKVVQAEPTQAPPPTEAPKPTEPPAPTEEPVAAEPEVTYDLEAIQADWEGSPHGNTYDLGKGPNTYCSRCHSPQNWDPEATTGRPPNCVTCKFPQDPELRIATTMDFVEEADWKGIACETCHPVVDGVVQAEVAWLNPITLENEPLNTPNELCGQCHADTKGVSASGGRGVEHAIILGGSAHLNWAGQLPQGHRPSYCTDCHNPHSTEPKQCVDCHDDMASSETHMKGFTAEHENVSCLACHDASGLDVGPHPDEAMGGEFTTLLVSTSRSGETTTEYVKSHSISWLVDCSRCHFEGNPWELSVLTAEGTPPEAAPAGGPPGN